MADKRSATARLPIVLLVYKGQMKPVGYAKGVNGRVVTTINGEPAITNEGRAEGWTMARTYFEDEGMLEEYEDCIAYYHAVCIRKQKLESFDPGRLPKALREERAKHQGRGVFQYASKAPKKPKAPKKRSKKNTATPKAAKPEPAKVPEGAGG